VAVPHIINSSGKEMSPSSLIYRWIENGSVLDNVSGVGKNSVILADSVLGLPINLEIQILTDSATVVADKKFDFSSIKPSLLVYESTPLYGILFNNEISDTFYTPDKEFSFAAIPLFFSTLTRNSPNINYTWTPSAANSGDQSSITYRQTDNTSGSTNVSVQAQNTTLITQGADSSFKINFNGAPSI